MREKMFVKGNNMDEMFESVERTLQRFSGKLQRVVTCLHPMVPIFNAVGSAEVGSDILRFLSPMGGLIKRCVVKIDDPLVKSFTVQLAVKGDEEARAIRITFQKGMPPIILDIPVSMDSKVVVTLESFELIRQSETPIITIAGIWTSILIAPERDGTKVEQYLIDTLKGVSE